MTHYLRNEDNKTVVDAEAKGKQDLNVVVCLDAFGPMLLNVERGNAIRMIGDFNGVQELRGKYFEGGNVENLTADEFLEKELKKIAEKYNLIYVID